VSYRDRMLAGLVLEVLAIAAVVICLVHLERGCSSAADGRATREHARLLDTAAARGTAARAHLLERDGRAPHARVLDSAYRALKPRARAATPAIRQLAAALPDSVRAAVDVHLAVKDSSAAAADSVIASLQHDTTDLAAAARDYRASGEAALAADSLIRATAKSDARTSFWRGASIGSGVTAVAVLVFTLIVVAAR
jgi:hypothetical protein